MHRESSYEEIREAAETVKYSLGAMAVMTVLFASKEHGIALYGVTGMMSLATVGAYKLQRFAEGRQTEIDNEPHEFHNPGQED